MSIPNTKISIALIVTSCCSNFRSFCQTTGPSRCARDKLLSRIKWVNGGDLVNHPDHNYLSRSHRDKLWHDDTTAWGISIHREVAEGGEGGGGRGFRLQVTGYRLQGHSRINMATINDQRATNNVLCEIQGGQVAQDAQVDQSIDISGFGSSVPRLPSCNKGGVAAIGANLKRKIAEITMLEQKRIC